MNENLPWSAPGWRWPGRINANRQLLSFVRSKPVDARRERGWAASILAGLASFAEFDPLVRIALDSDESLQVRVDCVDALRRLTSEGARVRPVDVRALLQASSPRLAFCCCEMCSSIGGELYLPLVVSAFSDCDSLHLVFRHLEAERIDPVQLLVVLERMHTELDKKLVAWLADRAARDTNRDRRVAAALATRALGVKHRLDRALQVDSVPQDPWCVAKRIALRLDSLDRPYLDVDQFVGVFGTRFERSVRDSLLAASFGSARAPRHLYAVLTAMHQGFDLAAKLLDDMTLGTDQVTALVMVMLEQNRRACLRWLARRSEQPQLLPALQRVVRELQRLNAEPDFVSTARYYLPELGQSASVRANEGPLDLTTHFHRTLQCGSARAFIEAVLSSEGIRPAKRRAPLRWFSARRERDGRLREDCVRGAG